MTINEYQTLAARTINPQLDGGDQELHSIFMIGSEAGEVQGIYQKIFQGHPFDENHVKKELGDLMWAVAELCTARGWELEEVCAENINKLRRRYPNGFKVENSINRAEGDI